MRRLGSPLVLVVALLMAGCGPVGLLGADPPMCVPPPLDPSLVHVDGLYVLPDDGRAPVIDEIDAATCSIDLTIYLLSDNATIDALRRAEARGVQVRILYEQTPFGGGVGIVETTEGLAEHGVQLRPSPDDFTFLHAKYLIADGQVAVITNQNLTYSAFESNRELGVVTTVPSDVTALAGIFEADWSGTSAPAPSARMILSPVNARASLLEQIRSAQSTIRLYAEVVRDDEIIDALSTAAQQDVAVQVIVNAPRDELDATVYRTLASNAVDIRFAGHIYIHAKGLIIDERAVVVGSHNPTATSLERNREVSLVIDDPIAVQRAMSVFDSDWNRSAP
jgi:cardiolipin synthase A/B